MTTTLVESALKTALTTCDCFDGVLPLWEFDGAFEDFAAGAACVGLRWAVLFGSESRERLGCNTIFRGSYRILIYAPPGSGRKASREAADCVICCLAEASPVRVTDEADEELGLKLHFSENGQKPFIRRRFKDGHGRAVTEIGVPYTAITCVC